MNKQKLLSKLKILIICFFLGIICGIIGALFSKGVAFVTLLRQNNQWLLYLLPVAGVFSVILYKLLKVDNMGTNQVIKSAEDEGSFSPKLAPAVFVASLLSHLCGATVGREGAALQLGGGSALFISKWFKVNKDEEKLLIYGGMAGVFASVFGTPLAAGIFALEVVFVGMIQLSAIVPTYVTALVSFFTARLLGAHAERFDLGQMPTFDFFVAWKFLVLTLLAICVAVAFCLSLHYSEKLFEKVFKNQYLRIGVGGVAIVLLTVIIGTTDYNGAGVNIIENIFKTGSFVPIAFLFKMLFTCISVGTGYKGGEIVPTLFIGATFGALIGAFLGLPVGFSAAISMITLFASVTNCPVASVLLAVELFSGKGVVYFIIAVVLSYFLSGKISLYSAQKIEGIKKKLW